MHLKLVVVVVAAALVAGCGSDDDQNEPARAGNGADRAFVADMIPHHQSAIEMATIASRRGQTAFVRSLARDIIRAQNAEIATMRKKDRQLADAGIKTGSLGVHEQMGGMDADSSSLKTARPFDSEFLEMMIVHHEGAITMAKAEIKNGSDPELLRLAPTIVRVQTREIAEMRKRLHGHADSTETRSNKGSHSG